MAAVKLTKHAQERLHERNITMHDIIRILAFGQRQPTRRPSVYRSCIRNGISSSRHQITESVTNVVVIYQNPDHSDEITVFTAYRNEPRPTAIARA